LAHRDYLRGVPVKEIMRRYGVLLLDEKKSTAPIASPRPNP
jgi:hypothetical protein